MTISCWLTTMGSPSRVSEVSFQHVTFLTYPEPRGIGIPELNWRFSKLVSLVSLELELLMGTSKKIHRESSHFPCLITGELNELMVLLELRNFFVINFLVHNVYLGLNVLHMSEEIRK